MDLARLKALIDQMASSEMPVLELVEGDEKIRILRAGHSEPAGTQPKPIPPPAKIQVTVQAQRETARPVAPSTVNAPMFGVCHLSPAPGAPAFASVGDKIAVGQTLCLIEAMKMFASVGATHAGVLKEVLIESGREVEAGQPLFRVEGEGGGAGI